MYYHKNLDNLQMNCWEKKKGTKTIHFVARNNIQVGHMATYSRILVHVHPYREYPIREWIDVEVNQIEYKKSKNKDGRSQHFQDTYQYRNLHTRRKICQMGHYTLLPTNTNRAVVIYDNTHHINFAVQYCTLQLK